MKKVALFSTLVLLMAVPAMAQQTNGSAEVKVEVAVVPNILVRAMSPYVNAGSIATNLGDDDTAGQVCAFIPFQVHANTEAVNLQVCATNLYKGGDANAPQIPLCQDEDSKVDVITGGLATRKFWPDNTLNWTSEVFTSHGLHGLCTEVGIFEAGSTGTFSIDLTVKVCWCNENPELPVGNYFGYVKLTAEINPNPVAPI
jgi:hypothetical protein